MSNGPQTQFLHDAGFEPDQRSLWQTTFLAVTGALASTVLLKIAQIQFLELLYLLQIIILLIVFARRDYRVIWFRPYLRLGIFWLFFAVSAAIVTVAALRFDFYLPLEVTTLKLPGVLAISREVELGADVCAMLYLAHTFRVHPAWLRFTMRVYFWTGMVSAAYSLISYPIAVAGIAELGTHQNTHRLKGFYNEGGPYGLYVVSLLAVGVVLWKLGWERRTALRWAMIALVPTLLLTRSKAAYCAVLAIVAINALVGASLTQRLATVGAGIAFLIVVSQLMDFTRVLESYRRVGATYERLSHFHSNDPSYVYGRVAGLYIVPRMVAAHPLTGIGWGNYGYLRNDPQYRGTAAWAKESDDASLGIWDLTADVGLPIFALLLLCVTLPYAYARKMHAPFYTCNLALVQIVVHLFGAQLNLTYPWVVSAFALGLIYAPSRFGGIIPATQAALLPHPFQPGELHA